jgi:spore germination cell wall hydrolase CwlJ-like protein
MQMIRLLCSSALVAASFYSSASAQTHAEEEPVRVHASLGCLAAAIYHEARSEPEVGQRAVAQVIMNRLRHPAYPKTVCDVVLQGALRVTGCQFTFTCDGSLARRPQPRAWAKAMEIAADTLAGRNLAPVADATHYHTTAIRPYWASSLTKVAVLGSHIFYAGGPNGRQRMLAPIVNASAVTAETPRVSVLRVTDADAGTAPVKIHRGAVPLLNE